LILGSFIIYYDRDIIYMPKINIWTRLSDLSLPKSPLLPTNSNCYTAYIISSNLTEAGPVNPSENTPAITPSKAYKGSNTLLKLTPIQDEYEGVN
jgi:hypothetical protein